MGSPETCPTFDPEYDAPLFYCCVCARELRRPWCRKCGTEDNTASNWIPNGKKQRHTPATPPAHAMTKMTPRKITMAEACDGATRILRDAEAARIEITTPPAPLVHPEVCAFCGIITTDAEPSDGTGYVCRDHLPCIDRARKACGLPPKPAPRDDQRARDAVVEAAVAWALTHSEQDNDALTHLLNVTLKYAALRGTDRPEQGVVDDQGGE